MREREHQIAAGDARDQLCPKRSAAAEVEETAAEHDGREPRLERQHAADLLHDDHGLDRPAGRAAMLFGEGQTKKPEFGVLLPHRAAPAAGLLRVTPARFERIVIGEQTLDAVLQKLLFFGQREVHFSSSTSAPPRQLLHVPAIRPLPNDTDHVTIPVHNPSIAFAMMFF